MVEELCRKSAFELAAIWRCRQYDKREQQDRTARWDQA